MWIRKKGGLFYSDKANRNQKNENNLSVSHRNIHKIDLVTQNKNRLFTQNPSFMHYYIKDSIK